MLTLFILQQKIIIAIHLSVGMRILPIVNENSISCNITIGSHAVLAH
jgi:hypothetical protein